MFSDLDLPHGVKTLGWRTMAGGRPTSGLQMTPADCIFCGGRPLTREHIYRRTYHTYAGTNRYYRVQITTGRSTPMAPHESTFNLTARVVCRGCNGGWMDQIDREVEPAATAFFDGRTYHCSEQMAKSVALWAAKTSAVRAFQGSSDRGVTDDDIRYIYDHQEPPSDWLIYIGHTSTVGSTNECRYAISELIDQTGHNATELPSGLLLPHTATFLIQEHWWAIEQMLLIVISLSGPAKTPMARKSIVEIARQSIESASLQSAPLVRLWPNPVAFDWPSDLQQAPIEAFLPVLAACEEIAKNSE